MSDVLYFQMLVQFCVARSCHSSSFSFPDVFVLKIEISVIGMML